MVRKSAAMRNVRHCHSSLSLKINGRMVTMLGLIPEKCKTRKSGPLEKKEKNMMCVIDLC